MATNGLTAQPLGQQGGFNWVFLVDVIVCGILAIFFLFYFNRVFATTISYAIRAYTWHKYRAYIDITSLQISLLGGRLFFKSIRYHGHNQTVLVHDGHITWRYWLRQVQDARIYQRSGSSHSPHSTTADSSEDSNEEKSRSRSKSVGKAEQADMNRQRLLPCRILIKVSGVEAFIYNQSPVYDNIINNLQKESAAKEPQTPTQDNPAAASDDASSTDPDLNHRDTRTSVSESFLATTASNLTTHQDSIPAFLNIFPVQVECRKAAAAIGNENTQSILTAKVENASGRIDADEAGALDLYKLLFVFDVNDIQVHLKSNADYKMSQMQAAARTSDKDERKAEKGRAIFGLHPIRRTRKILRSLAQPVIWIMSLTQSSKGSVRTASINSQAEVHIVDDASPKIPGEAEWHGLARYLDETGNEHNEWDNVEYARFSNIAQVKKASMKFYWDVPGKVVQSDLHTRRVQSDEMNGQSPPEYGIDLSVDGAVINYGPWADRQRIILQNIFFPASFHDAQPAGRLAVNQDRVATIFKLFFCLESEVVLRIPTRESSKDWKWQGRADNQRAKSRDSGLRKRRGKSSRKFGKRKQQETTSGADVRPFGWIDVTVAADTTINYAMDMYARHDGFHNTMTVDVKGTEISSSVNHAPLWKAGNLVVEGDLSNPLKWNALRKWKFKIDCDGLDLFILRDHLFLLTDLIADWTTGPPPDFYTFVPFIYALEVNFENFSLYLNANDANIVNDPSDVEDNNFLILNGEELHADLEIPLNVYRPAQNGIKFDVLAHNMSLDISNPSRITLHSLLRQKRLATLKKLTLGGSHTFFVDQAPGLVDMLQMDICGSELELQAFGYLVRFFINVKENYFGEFLHFKTLEEYQNSGADAANAEANMAGRFAFRPANDLDVVLSITTDHPVIKMPANLYSAETYIKIELPIASVDLRVANYYLDLALDVSPVAISWHGIPRDEDQFDSSSPQLILDSAIITGHRLFGLPPTEPSYVSNWDVSLGNVSGDCTLDFVQQLAKAGRAFAFAMDDHENALPLAQTAPIPEAVFLRLKTGSVCVWLNEGESALRMYTAPIALNMTDRADSLFSSRLHLSIPDVTATCIDANSVAHHRSRGDEKPAKCIAFVQTSLEVNMVQRRAHFKAETAKQQDHIRSQDVRSGRAKFLLEHSNDNEVEAKSEQNDLEPPSMRLPKLPDPIVKEYGGPLRTASIKSSIRSHAVIDHTTTTKALPESNLPDTTGKTLQSAPHELHEAGLPSSTMGLSSPFAVPDPHLLDVNADFSRVPTFTRDVDTVKEADVLSDTSSRSNMSINIEDENNLDQMTFMVRLVPGIRIYVEPRISDSIVNIVSTLQPKRSEDVIDTFHMDVMGNVQQVQDQKKSRRGIFELNLVVPSIEARLFNDQELDTSKTVPKPVQDQLDVSMGYLNLTLRSKPSASQNELESALLLHLTLDSALVEFSNPLANSTISEAAIRSGFDDVLIWLVLSQSQSVHVSFKDLLGVVSGQQADYLASVFSRYAAIGTTVQKQADAVEIGGKTRLRRMTDFLTDHGSVSSDPPYLSRMSYILRAFPDHFRNQDSWKIIARFRHIYECLPEDKRVELEQYLIDDSATLKDTSAVIETWAEWCSWDIPNIEQAQIFKLLLGDADPKIPEDEIKSIDLTLQAGTVRIAVESGKNSSEVSLGSLSVGVTKVPPSLPSGLMLVEENLRSKTILQAHTTATVIRLHWDIMEQADKFIDVYFEQVAQTLDTLPDTSVDQAPEEVSFREDFHVVISTDEGSIELKTINLRHVSRSENLRTSIIGTDRASQDYGKCISVLVSARSAFTELHGPNEKVLHTDLIGPSIYLDVKEMVTENVSNINVGGSYDRLNITFEQEIHGLLELADTILTDEVKHILKFQKHIMKEQKQSVETRGVETSKRDLRLNVALLAGPFALNVALLKALSFSMRGDSANLRIRPHAGPNSSWIVELHLGAMEQALIHKDGKSKAQRAIFHSPPASSTIGLDFSEEKIDVSFSGVLEEVVLDAAAVQSVLTIINRSEVQSVLEAIRDQITDIEHRSAEIFKDDTTQMVQVNDQKEQQKQKQLIYDIDTTLAGFRITATAPVLTAGKARAELSFGLGRVQASVTNKALQDKTAIPDIHATIQNIGAKLTLVEREKRRPCGHVTVSIAADSTTKENGSGHVARDVKARSESFDVHLYADTASTVVDIVTHVHKKILDLDLSKEVEYLRRLRHSREKRNKKTAPPVDAATMRINDEQTVAVDDRTRQAIEVQPTLIDFSLDLRKIRLVWIVDRPSSTYGDHEPQDLELSCSRIHLSIQKHNEARLSIQNLQLQVVPKKHEGFERTENSALLPEVVFTVRYDTGKQGIRIAFQAAGQALEIRLDSSFVVPVSMLEKSISKAIDQYRAAKLSWQTEATDDDTKSTPRKSPFGDKRLASLQADANFAGALFYIQGDAPSQGQASLRLPQANPSHKRNRSSAASQDVIATSLRAPGIAIKIEYTNETASDKEQTLNGEIKVDASSNTVYPELVPIILQITDSVKEVVRYAEERDRSPAPPKAAREQAQKSASKLLEDDSVLMTDPSQLLGQLKLNLGLRICRQEFGLSCQPLARVNAKLQIEDIYITMSTINSGQFGHFFALSAMVTHLSTSVQHVYSRDSTFSFDMESISLSLMNSKHLTGGSSGLSTVLKIAPTKTALNVRQIQDLLLFREIWFPEELRGTEAAPAPPTTPEPEEMLVQRYQQVSAAAAFPWNATISVADLAVDLELGQSIGKSCLNIKNLWASSKKSSSSKQDLCIGIDEVSVKSTGRMSGFIELSDVSVRTSIEWPQSGQHKAPLVQAAVGFGKILAKSALDYQPFAFADIEAFNFLMYNVRDDVGSPDRLVAILEGDKVYVFCTATSPAQAVGLYQAFDRLVQEKQAAYKQSMTDLDKQLRRRSANPLQRDEKHSPSPLRQEISDTKDKNKFPITLHTDVVVMLKSVCIGAFPSTFFDSQILKLEASEIQARFAVGKENERIHSTLGMTLGQLQVALAQVKRVSVPKTLGDISINEVIVNATTSKGGIILRVPKVNASMQTWQQPRDNNIDFIFQSLFEGKVDVGWNYSRISFIRGMWNTHSRSLASRLGKPLPESAVKITAGEPTSQKVNSVAQAESNSNNGNEQDKLPPPPSSPTKQSGKITAVVNVPQSKYEYTALEPPIVETPQLRDMGEATPPLEWIGLHREKLPNVTHQIVIVTLLEVAKEVEDAYERILGSS